MARVAWFSSDRFVPGPESLDWGDEAIGLSELAPEHEGGGVKVAVLDTGIDCAHPDLRVCQGRGFVQGETREVFGDDSGHGTFVAGVLAALRNQLGLLGVAPAARLLVGRVGRVDLHTGRYANDAATSLAEALDWAVDSGADVVNMSIEFPQLATAKRARLDRALQRAAQLGVILVAATGNGGRRVSYPASNPFVLGVGAVGSLLQSPLEPIRAQDPEAGLFVPLFSNFGKGLDVLAPGVRIPSTHPVAAGSYARHRGTSLAAPYVAGVCALLVEAAPLRRGSWSLVREICGVLRSTAQPLRGVTPFMQGAGVVDAARAFKRWIGEEP